MTVRTKADARAKREPTAAEHLNDALMHLLHAVPVGHLDKRMTSIQKWLVKTEKDLAKAFAPPQGRTRSRVAGASRRGAAVRVAPRNSTETRSTAVHGR